MNGQKQDRRAHERRAASSPKTILVNEKDEALLKDISLGGLRFQSAEPLDVGHEIAVGNRLMRLNASVLECRADPHQGEEEAGGGHEIRCRFIPTEGRLQEQMLMDLVMDEEVDWPTAAVKLSTPAGLGPASPGRR